MYRLFRAGANDIVREMFDSSLRAGRYVLENVGLSEYEAHEAEKAFYKHDRHAMRQLAPLWDPDKPVYENEAYVARAKELEQELESTMLSTVRVKPWMTMRRRAKRQSRGLTLCNTCLCKSGHARVAGHSSLYNTQRRGGP